MAERMATVGRLSLKVAHEVRNPIAAIELNAEMLQDIVRVHPGTRHGGGDGPGGGDPRPGHDARRAHRGVPGLRALPQAALRGASRSTTSSRSWPTSCGRWRRARGSRSTSSTDPGVPHDGDRPRAPAPGGAQPREERHGGALARRRADDREPLRRRGRRDRGVGHRRRHHRRGRPSGCSSRSSRPSRRAPGSGCRSPARSSTSTAASSAGATARGGGATFTIRLPVKRPVSHV